MSPAQRGDNLDEIAAGIDEFRLPRGKTFPGQDVRTELVR